MKTFQARIKEKNHDSILTPTYVGNDHTTISYLIQFWGLDNDDVEWYDIEEITE